MSEETKLCSNCQRDISIANFVMHDMHCRKHIVLCQHCGQPVHRSEMEEHFNSLHAQVPCGKCQQLVAKTDMEKHLLEQCTKRLIGCEYCELSLTSDELASHLDYCGSRTEACPVCQQYIMQKDKLRHESSGCSFPEPKPPPPPPTTVSDPFSMDELQQFMTNAMLGNIHFALPDMRQNKTPINKKSTLNAQTAKNVCLPEVVEDNTHSTTADEDYDTMLALQLAHEDWVLDNAAVDTDADDTMRYLPMFLESDQRSNDITPFLDDGDLWDDSETYREPQHTFLNSVRLPDDEDMSIPCEFCEVLVPLSGYIGHTESCPLAPERATADLNNEQIPLQHTANRPATLVSRNTVQNSIGQTAIPVNNSPIRNLTSRTAISVINNLRPLEILPQHPRVEENEDEDVMLPCEFCQESFPADAIIQHQGVCQAASPRNSPPASPVGTEDRTSWFRQAINENSVQPVGSSSKQKNPMSNYFVEQSPDDDLSNARVHTSNESCSNKYSPAYNRFSEALTRPPHRPVRQMVHEENEQQEPRTESRSVQRTRASLNKLLQADSSPEDVSTGAMGASRQTRTEPRERNVMDTRTGTRQLEERVQRQPPARRMNTSRNVANSSRINQSPSLPNSHNSARFNQSPSVPNSHNSARSNLSPSLPNSHNSVRSNQPASLPNAQRGGAFVSPEPRHRPTAKPSVKKFDPPR